MSTLHEDLELIRKMNGSTAPMPAPRTEVLELSAFLEECETKPSGAIVVGLRTPNDKDYQEALSQDSDERIVLFLVSRGVCDPNDCRNRHPVFPMPDDQLPLMLKPATIRYLYDRIEQLHIETSPTVAPATDSELALLGDALLVGDALETLAESNPGAEARVRRLATAIFQALELDAEVTIDTSPAAEGVDA